MKSRAEINETEESDRKRARTGKAPGVEKALVKWIENARDKNAPLSGKLVKAKSEEFASKMNVPEFKATEGWFSRFKKREGIVHKRLHGEGQTADSVSRDHWMNHVWPDLKKRFNEEQIWNADESGVYIRALPDSTLTFKNDTRKGAKTQKERITVLFACSATGEKRKMLVIGKSLNPRCFNGINKTTLPVTYEANTSAWMTGDLFRKWLSEWDKELRGQNKHILLLVDNCSAHPQNVNLTNIELAFFPPNTTAILQPCDQGVIRAVKAHYRRYMCQRILQQMDAEDNSATACALAKKITLLVAIDFLVMAWGDIEKKSIRNCWRKGGLVSSNEEAVEDVPDDIPLPEEQFNAYVDIDHDLETSAEVTDDDIISSVMDEEPSITDAEEEEEVIQVDDGDEIPSNKEMRKALDILKTGLYARGFDDYGLIHRLERAVHVKSLDSLTQSKVDAFFAL